MFKRLLILLSATFLLLNSQVTFSSEPDPGRFDPLLGTEWYGVYMQGAKAGYAEMMFEKVEAPSAGWRTKESMTMILNVLGKIDTMKITDSRLYISPGGELHSNKLVYSSITGDMIVEGAREADEYIVSIELGGQRTKKVFDYPVTYLDSIKYVNLEVLSGDIAPGDSINSSYFEATPPLTGLVHTRVRVESIDKYNFNGVPTDVYTLSFAITEMNFTGQSIFDRSGRELELILGGGIMLKLEGEALAKTIDSNFDFLADNLIHPQNKINNPGILNQVELRISGIEIDDLLNTANQVVSIGKNNILRVKINRSKGPKTVLNLPFGSEELMPYLQSDVYIQSDANEIKNLAAEITGGESDSWKAAREINRWVFKNVEKEFTPDFSNALQTLRTRRGDCGEHAALATALMRAAGIPARTVTGLVYWPPGEGFGYHAWIEVFVGEWVMMDPSWGEDLVNPTHIALTTGDLIKQVGALQRVMGKIGIEVVEAR